jgi:hypothetical protein
MAKIRNDLDGVVYAGGHVLKAGDTIPAGVPVGAHLTADGKAHGYPKPDPAPVVVEAGVEPLTELEQVRALELGIPEGVHPERVRGAIDGYEQGLADSAEAAAAVEAERVAADAAAAAPLT